MDGWIDRWMDGWMDGWIDRYSTLFNYIHWHMGNELIKTKVSVTT